jgi:flavodoxin
MGLKGVMIHRKKGKCFLVWKFEGMKASRKKQITKKEANKWLDKIEEINNRKSIK